MKDDRIRYVHTGKRALVANGVRAAVITNANLNADDMAQRILRAIDDLAVVCDARNGPFLFALHATRIEEIALDRS